jgi:hypothetical protein
MNREGSKKADVVIPHPQLMQTGVDFVGKQSSIGGLPEFGPPRELKHVSGSWEPSANPWNSP